jgi:hypothetical protein
MSVRKTEVAWDPRLVRLEYLDEDGNPYYCSFRKRYPPAQPEVVGPSGGPHARPGSEAAEALTGALLGALFGALVGLVIAADARGAPRTRGSPKGG